jgi:hypothetical protein
MRNRISSRTKYSAAVFARVLLVGVTGLLSLKFHVQAFGPFEDTSVMKRPAGTAKKSCCCDSRYRCLCQAVKNNSQQQKSKQIQFSEQRIVFKVDLHHGLQGVRIVLSSNTLTKHHWVSGFAGDIQMQVISFLRIA